MFSSTSATIACGIEVFRVTRDKELSKMHEHGEMNCHRVCHACKFGLVDFLTTTDLSEYIAEMKPVQRKKCAAFLHCHGIKARSDFGETPETRSIGDCLAGRKSAVIGDIAEHYIAACRGGNVENLTAGHATLDGETIERGFAKACKFGHVDAAKCIGLRLSPFRLEYGLSVACTFGQIGVIRAILELNAKRPGTCNLIISRLLPIACQYNREDIVRLLLGEEHTPAEERPKNATQIDASAEIIAAIGQISAKSTNPRNCIGTTASGHKCSRKLTESFPFCPQHSETLVCMALSIAVIGPTTCTIKAELYESHRMMAHLFAIVPLRGCTTCKIAVPQHGAIMFDFKNGTLVSAEFAEK